MTDLLLSGIMLLLALSLVSLIHYSRSVHLILRDTKRLTFIEDKVSRINTNQNQNGREIERRLQASRDRENHIEELAESIDKKLDNMLEIIDTLSKVEITYQSNDGQKHDNAIVTSGTNVEL